MNEGLDHLGIDPDLQRPALAVVRGRDIVLVACPKTSGTKQQAAVLELASEAMHWMDTACEELAFAGHHFPSMATVTVEAQKVYWGSGSTKNPQDIVVLAAAAGVMLNAAVARWPHADADFPLPETWKKGVPKHIHQARVLSRLGVSYQKAGGKSDPYCVPLWPEGKRPIGAEGLNKSDWKHVVDAIGLAVYGQERTRR